MNDSNTEHKDFTGPVDKIEYDSDSNFDESRDLLSSNERSNNAIEGNLLK